MFLTQGARIVVGKIPFNGGLDDQLQVLLRDWIGLELSHRPLDEHRLADRHAQDASNPSCHLFQPSQSQTARPITSWRSRPLSHDSSSVNSVTHWRHGQGMRVMSVPQKNRVGPNAS